MTLKKAILLSLSGSIDASIINRQEEGLEQKRQLLDESKVKHVLTGKTGYSKNEIGDSQDLESSAMEISTFTLSYQQIFENGFTWTASQINRTGVALTPSQVDEEYSKQLLTAKLPIFGNHSESSWLTNRKLQIDIENTQKEMQIEKNSLQTEVAQIYVDTYVQYQALDISNRKLALYQAELDRKSKTLTRLTEIDYQLLELELQKEKISNDEKKTAWQESRQKLQLILGKNPDNRLTLPQQLPTFHLSDAQAIERYQAFSPKLLQLQYQLQLLQREEEILDLATVPTVYAGGFVGNSSLNEIQGSNYGLNLTVRFNFGGGESEKVSAVRKELAVLNLKLDKEQKNAAIDYYKARGQFQSALRKAELGASEIEIYSRQLQLAQQKFNLGEIDRNKLTDLELEALDKRLEMIRAHAECWTSYLSIVKRTNTPVLEMLE